MMRAFLMESVRVVNRQRGERSFPIFPIWWPGRGIHSSPVGICRPQGPPQRIPGRKKRGISLWILHCGLHSCCPVQVADRRAKGLDEECSMEGRTPRLEEVCFKL